MDLFTVGVIVLIIGLGALGWGLLRRRFSRQSRLLVLAIVTALLASGLFVAMRLTLRIG